MLNRIRNLSSHPVMLLMFGMLVLVFTLFFGMPSMGDINQGGGILNQTGATVYDTEIELREAYTHVTQYFNARGDRELKLTEDRLRELENETLIDVIAQRTADWQVSDKEVKSYMTSGGNYQHVHFSAVDDVERDQVANAFKSHIKAQGKELKDLSAEELIATYMTFSSKARGFSHKLMSDFLERFTVDQERYFNTKARELRVRSYLSFLRSHVKAGQAALDDEIKWSGRSWTFDLVTIGPDQAAGLAPATPDQVKAYIKDHADEIKARYEEQEKLNQNKVKLLYVTANYTKANEAAVKAKVEEARTRLEKGEEPKAITKALSDDAIKVLMFPRNGTEKQVGEDAFKAGFALDPKAISAVSRSATSTDEKGAYFAVRLDEKVVRKETTLEGSQDEIAAELWLKAQRKERVAADAAELHAQLKSGVALAAAVDAYNAQSKDQEGFKAVEISTSEAVSLDALASGRVPSISKTPGVADQLLAEIMTIDDNNRVPSVLKAGDQVIVLSLKESKSVGVLELGTEREKRELSARLEAQSEFFGGAWTMMALGGHQKFGLANLYMPRELQIPVLMEVYAITNPQMLSLMMQYQAPPKGFLDALLKSESYRQFIKENPVVTKFFANKGGEG